ncbi:hypothetical protein [uncultured Winogradskyella sp.]|uniref:hypothetical protein n=1 Tax=uncultured Winogradskyella sp. TaxID=395353 RepID=UPI00261182FD|nr:hypothetical protein [uncultured Winogradskyella sp.]
MSNIGNYKSTLTWRNFHKANAIRKKLEAEIKEEKILLSINAVSNEDIDIIKEKIEKLNMSSQDMLDFYCSSTLS